MPTSKDEYIFKEIFDASNINSFMAFAYNLGAQAIPDDPSWVWQQLRFNPWLAMQVYDDMEEKDAMVFTALEQRKDGLLAKDRMVKPASDKRQDKKLAEFIEETLEGYFDQSDGVRTGMEQFLYEALDAIAKGVAIGEIIYAEASDRVYIKTVKFRPQHLFSFSEGPLAAYSSGSYVYPQAGPLRLRPGIILDNVDMGAVLPEKKFFVHSYRPRYGNRWGSPLDRKAYWPSWFKRAGVKNWLRYTEKGSGSVVTKYRQGAGEDEQDKALQAAQAVNEESAVAVPESFLMEVMQHVRTSMGSTYRELIDDFCNNEIVRVYLGQTLTTRGSEGGAGSRALGGVHERVSESKINVDAKSLIIAVNTQIVWPLVILKEGPVKKPPIWWIDYLPERDHSATSTWLTRLWETKIPISKSFVYNNFPGIEPESDEDILQPPADNKEPDLPASGTDPTAFSEEGDGQKKKPDESSGRARKPQSLKKERFTRLRPSMIQFSEE